MKKLSLLLLGVILISSAGFAQKNALISGKVTTKNTIQKVYLMYSWNDDRVTDSASVEKGAFSFNTKITSPTLVILRLKYPPKDGQGRPGFEAKQLYVDPGTTQINISDSLKNATVKGGQATKDFESLGKLEEPFNAKGKSLQAQYMEFRKAKDEEGMKKIEGDFDAMDSAMKVDVYLKFLKANSKSPVALYALEQYSGYDIDPAKVSPYYEALSPSVKSSPSGKAFGDRIEIARKTAVGAMAMNFTQNDTLEKPVSLSDFKGKYVLVDFWASWCGPCRAENPNVVEAFNKYKDKNFTVLGVSLDQPGAKEKWLEAIHKDNLTWTHVSDLKFWENAVAQQYGIRAIPQNLLIDPTGKIIAKNIRGEDLQNKLNEILN